MKHTHIRSFLWNACRLLIVLIAGSMLSALCSSCATSGYLGDRMRDAGDMFTATAGMGAGAKARIGPMQVGALYNIDMWGIRGGDFGPVPWYETCTRDALFPVPAKWIGYPMAKAGQFGEERFAHSCECDISWQRGKDFVADAPLPILGLTKQAEYYTQIEVVVAAFGSIRLGFNPGELLDFILGWTTLDIYSDDLWSKNRPEGSAH